jgi:hypothetical protein
LGGAVVDGAALAGDVEGNVLDELERALAAISPGLADARASAGDEDVINELVRAAAEQWRSGHADDSPDAIPPDPGAIKTLRSALEALARVLAGPRGQQYRVASSSNPGSHYTIDVDGGDVTCSCPGFEYRGQCRHARDVKKALASGAAPPSDYVAVA